MNYKKHEKKSGVRIIQIAVIFLFFILAGSCTQVSNKATSTRYQASGVSNSTLVVCDPKDPYFSLAQEISREENLLSVSKIDDVLPYNARYILLVAAPQNLNADRLAHIGQFFSEHDTYPALGIISASTLDSARQLYHRRERVKAETIYYGGDTEILQFIDMPTLHHIIDEVDETSSLNKENLIAALRQADYMYWTRHSGPSDWSWNEESGDWSENDQIRAADIPSMKAAVIYSLTCSSFRPWQEHSMALGFVDQGAAAYLGNLNTPHTIVVMKHGAYLPGVNSWSEFPLGIVAQIHNQVSAKHVFTSPQTFMLGDPRIYLSKEQPYHILSDIKDGNGRRILTGTSSTRGILPVRIENGSSYASVSVTGLSTIHKDDFFYNNKLQALDLGEEKYLLFPHDGGDFEIVLQESAPWLARFGDALLDALDFSWIVFWLNTYIDWNPHLNLLAIPVFITILLYSHFKHKKSLSKYRLIFIFAIFMVTIHAIYFCLRVNEYSVSNALVDLSLPQLLLGFLGEFSAISGGLILMIDREKKGTKFFGMILTMLRQIWMSLFFLVFITFINTLTPITRNTDVWLLSYESFWAAFLVLLIDILLILIMYRYLQPKIVQPTTAQGKPQAG